MDLQLGLSLPVHHHPFQGSDQTNHGLGSKQMVCSELSRPSCCFESKNNVKGKRGFEESFGHSLKPLPLLVWSGQPNEEDDRSGKKHKNAYTTNKDNEEEKCVVGWPPIKSWRKKKFHHQPQAGGQNRMPAENESRGSNSLYVKVKMEGVAIGRKIDLRLYSSYQTLTNMLITMFAKYQKFEKDGARYTLTYQDQEGDWLLAGDVPWQSFMDSVQRLKILRNRNETT